VTRDYIGVDLQKRFFQACAISVTGDRLWEQRFPRTADGIDRFSAHMTRAESRPDASPPSSHNTRASATRALARPFFTEPSRGPT
jgi:hypothetical protein